MLRDPYEPYAGRRTNIRVVGYLSSEVVVFPLSSRKEWADFEKVVCLDPLLP
jgi:hypothetical protein